MTKQAGLWIDHRKAVIVTLVDKTENVQQIVSNLPKRTRRAGGARSKTPYGPQDVMAEGKRDNEYNNQLKQYYEEVRAALGDVDALMLFGPGKAKIEFRKHLEKEQLSKRVIGVKTTDKLTDRQIAAEVRQHFSA